MGFAVLATLAIAGTAASLEESRRARKTAEIEAGHQAAREKRQLEKEERTLEESKISARQKALSTRRARALRRGRRSTIIAGRGITPNLTRLGEARKKELGAGV